MRASSGAGSLCGALRHFVYSAVGLKDLGQPSGKDAAMAMLGVFRNLWWPTDASSARRSRGAASPRASSDRQRSGVAATCESDSPGTSPRKRGARVDWA